MGKHEDMSLDNQDTRAMNSVISFQFLFLMCYLGNIRTMLAFSIQDSYVSTSFVYIIVFLIHLLTHFLLLLVFFFFLILWKTELKQASPFVLRKVTDDVLEGEN